MADPTSLTLTEQAGDVLLEWPAPAMADATHTAVFRRTGVDTTPFDPAVDTEIARVLADTLSYTDAGVADGNYAYQVFPLIDYSAVTQFTPDSLNNLFALYNADRVSDQTIAEDTFTDTDGILLTAHTSDSGHTWTLHAGPSWTITNNKARTAGGAESIITTNTSFADGVVEMVIPPVDTANGLIFRGIDANNFLVITRSSSSLFIQKREAGTYTGFASIAHANTTSTLIRVSYHADRIKVWAHDPATPVDYSTTDPLMEYTLSSADYTTFGGRTRCGMRTHANDGNRDFDNFKVSTLDQVADHTVGFDSFTRADGTTIGSTEVGVFAWTTKGGSWSIDTNRLEHNGGLGEDHRQIIDTGITDGVFSLTVYGDSGLTFRGSSVESTYLYVELDGLNEQLRLKKYTTGTSAIIAQVSLGYAITLTTKSDLQVVVNVDRIMVFLNGQLLIDHTLSSADQTTFGALTYAGAWGGGGNSQTFDNFRVRRLTRVPVWADVSRTGTDRVNATHFKNTTEAQQPLFIEDWHGAGVGAVWTDGVNDYLQSTIGPVAQPGTVHSVFKAANSSAAGDLHAGDNNSDRWLMDWAAGSTWRMYAGASLNGTAVDNDTHSHVAVFNGATSSWRLDGVQIISGNAGTQSLSGNRIGRDLSTGYTEGYWSLLAIENAATTQAADFEHWYSGTYEKNVRSPLTAEVVSQTTGGNTNGGNVTIPLTAQEGDLIVVVGASPNSANASLPLDAGYTTEDSFVLSDASYSVDHKMAVSSKVMGSTPDTSVTVQGTGGTTHAVTASVWVLRNATSVTTAMALGAAASLDVDMPAVNFEQGTALLGAVSRAETTNQTFPNPIDPVWDSTADGFYGADTIREYLGVAYTYTSHTGLRSPGQWHTHENTKPKILATIAVE